MKKWMISETNISQDRVISCGNKFLTGNGYLGIRGTFPDANKEDLAAINLSGIYDQVGDKWREPLNALNPLYVYSEFNNKVLDSKENSLNRDLKLDYRRGLLEAIVEFEDATILMERFPSMKNKHLIAMKYEVKAKKDGVLTINTGIDSDIWEINGPHYDKISFSDEEGILVSESISHENKDKVYVLEKTEFDFEGKEEVIISQEKALRKITLKAEQDKSYIIYKFITIYTSKDANSPKEEALKEIKTAMTFGYEYSLKEQKDSWENIWRDSEVIIEGDDEAMEALNYSIYHLESIAPRHSESLSIAARGLSGQTYKGAIFWDTEMFMLDLFLNTDPKVAKTLLKYRVDTLEGALNKAKFYGYEGAFYAWESQEGGYDACSDYNVIDVFTGRPMRTFFKDKQYHISSAVVFGLMRYKNSTNDYSLLVENGAKTIIECAKFYYSLLMKKVNSDRFEILDVIGPDEYHERVNNNAYTNRMAKFTFESAIEIIEKSKNIKFEGLEDYNLEELIVKFKEASDKMFIQEPEEGTLIIEQFDGYKDLEYIEIPKLKERLLHEKEYWGGAYGIASHTKVIKQADVIAMLNLFSDDYLKEVLVNNFNYYEPRTEHGSSLSACMYGLVACKCGNADLAYKYFMKSAKSDLVGGGKEWAGLLYIGGTHPASAGGAYKLAVEGFAGLSYKCGKFNFKPNMPKHWKSMAFTLNYEGNKYKVLIKEDNATIKEVR